MVGRSLLPFGDTFAVLMVVFLVLSLSVGRHTSGPDGSVVREPMLVVIAGGDPFGTEAEALVAFSSNADGVDYRHTTPRRTPNVERLIVFLSSALDDAEIVAQFPDPDTDFPTGWITPIPANTPLIDEYIRALQAEVPAFRVSGAVSRPPNQDGSLTLPDLPSPDGDLYALTDSCRQFQSEARNPSLLDDVDLIVTGFMDSVAPSSVSLALDAARADAVTLVGLFDAPPPPADPEFLIERLAVSPATCVGFEGAAGVVFDADTVIDPTAPCDRFLSPLQSIYEEMRRAEAIESGADVPDSNAELLVSEIPRRPQVLVRPRDQEIRRRFGELAYHSIIPRPVDIRVFQTDGDERRFRTPTWWEMFVGGRGVGPNDAWTTDAQCRANEAAFLAGDADDVAHLFSFRMTISRDGDIDHHGTLIELPVR